MAIMSESDDCAADADNTGGDRGSGHRAAVTKKMKTAGRDKGLSYAGALLVTPAATLLCAALLVAVLPQPWFVAGSQLYTNTFAVKLHGHSRDGGDGHVDEEVAHRVAKRAGSGFENVGKVRETRRGTFVH